MNNDKLLYECKQIQEKLVQWRRILHRIPEPGLELPKTVQEVKQTLENIGVELQGSYNGVGVVALVRGKADGPGKTIAIRADMDALEIDEKTGRPYGSTHPGLMHACGHDAHTAIALGVASILNENRESFSGTVKFLFQPAEETLGGAQLMVEQGALENPKVDAVIGLHIGDIWQEVGCGQIGVRFGPSMAAADSFSFTLKGPGAHGAQPHRAPDLVLAASQIITQLHTIVSRNVDPVDPAVITVGKIKGGTARNVIPTEIHAEGTARTLTETTRTLVEKKITQIVRQVAESAGCTHELSYYRGAPPVVGDNRMIELVRDSAREILGEKDVHEIVNPSMGAEDMSIFMEAVPGCYFALGAHNPEAGFESIHHSPVFDIDESVMWKGTAVFTAATLRFLADEF